MLYLYTNCVFFCTEMAERTESGWEDSPDSEERTPDYHKLIDYGLNEKVAVKLDQIYQQGKLKHEVSGLICLVLKLNVATGLLKHSW